MSNKNKQANTSKKNRKRKRPTTLFRDQSKHQGLRKRWRSWLKPMRLELTNLKWRQEIFWKLQEISKQNKEILNPGEFFNWICGNYNIAVTVGVRRFDDKGNRDRSLWKMLYEILENPGVINRRAHLALYRKNQKRLGNATFDSLIGAGKLVLSQTQVRSDLRKLEDAAERIRLLVNKQFAHFTKGGGIKKLPQYKDLDNLLDTIVKILSKYNLLLTAGNIPSFDGDPNTWMEVLMEPWLLPESGYYKQLKGIL